MPVDLGMNPKTERFNSALYWFPRITKAGLPVPRTETVRLTSGFVWRTVGEEQVTEDSTPADGRIWAAILTACVSIGFPVFIRSDKRSAKHRGPSHYRADCVSDVGDAVRGTFDHHLENDLVGELWPDALLVRKWLDLNAAFTAFDGHRIAREYRIFATPERVLCAHFYWPEEAMEFRGVDNPPEDWKERLRNLANVYDAPLERLGELAMLAAAACPEHPKWSVDFAEDVRGKYWLIDMAIAERSWHPEDCPRYAEASRRL